MNAPLRSASPRWLLAAALLLSGVAAAQPEPARPFRAGEQLAYRVSFGVLGGGSGSLRVDPAAPIRGEPAVRLSFEFAGRAGPFKVSHSSRSWLSDLRWASLRYEVDESVPVKPVFERVELFPSEQRWSGIRGEGATPSADPVDELSFLFLLRSMELVPGESHSLTRHYDAGRNPVMVTVLGRDRIRVPAGEFDTLLVEMRVRDPKRCKGNGVLRVNVSDDEARLPVRIVSTCPLEVSLELTSATGR